MYPTYINQTICHLLEVTELVILKILLTENITESTSTVFYT